MKSLEEVFLDLIKIPSPSGKELEVGKYIQSYFQSLGRQTHFDKTGKKNHSNSGNILVESGKKSKWPKIMLVSHMDTVQDINQIIDPKIKNGLFYSDGKTILGADDKSGVAIMLLLAKETELFGSNLCFVFTTREEEGEMGSSLLDIKKINADFIINIDGGKKVGSIDTNALGQSVFQIAIKGRASHAATNPEKGVNAIKIAAEIVTDFPLGKRSNGDTCNIGYIHGGNKVNIVPEEVFLKGEVRSYSAKRLNQQLKDVETISQKITLKNGGKLEFRVFPELGVPVFEKNITKDFQHKIVRAGNKTGVKVDWTSMQACSDANYLARYGKQVISVNRGGKDAHAKTESIRLSEIEKTLRLVKNIVLELS